MTFIEYYKKQLAQDLMKELGITNPMAVPKFVKIVVNVGVGEAATNKKLTDKVAEEVAIIVGQKPVITLARKSVSVFKIRQGMPIGVKVTLRGDKMLEFYEKLVKIVLPRIRDFRGISDKCFDGRGNFNLGLTEQILFPEIEYDKVDKIRGLEVTVVTNTQDDVKAKKLLEILGMPFRELK